ncbi:5566_t:CDS:2 [Scutellospora calospora]|uniref:5566_t:CDS:1 n=1 Tax=Scutellospora calospora TaxID=85575 RepID=A0ACA9LI07_9GLOM|nr:5566_t:CDS:2 [Scutellospora calospora]
MVKRKCLISCSNHPSEAKTYKKEENVNSHSEEKKKRQKQRIKTGTYHSTISIFALLCLFYIPTDPLSKDLQKEKENPNPHILNYFVKQRPTKKKKKKKKRKQTNKEQRAETDTYCSTILVLHSDLNPQMSISHSHCFDEVITYKEKKVLIHKLKKEQ